MSALPADPWLETYVPSFLAAHPIYRDNPTLFILLDALVREQEENTPDLVMDDKVLNQAHASLVKSATALLENNKS